MLIGFLILYDLIDAKIQIPTNVMGAENLVRPKSTYYHLLQDNISN